MNIAAFLADHEPVTHTHAQIHTQYTSTSICNSTTPFLCPRSVPAIPHQIGFNHPPTGGDTTLTTKCMIGHFGMHYAIGIQTVFFYEELLDVALLMKFQNITVILPSHESIKTRGIFNHN